MPAHAHQPDPDAECPECQVQWAEVAEAMSTPGVQVQVQLPADVAPWYDENAWGASWKATVVYVNGDSLDVTAPDGSVEPVDLGFCRPLAG